MRTLILFALLAGGFIDRAEAQGPSQQEWNRFFDKMAESDFTAQGILKPLACDTMQQFIGRFWALEQTRVRAAGMDNEAERRETVLRSLRCAIANQDIGAFDGLLKHYGAKSLAQWDAASEYGRDIPLYAFAAGARNVAFLSRLETAGGFRPRSSTGAKPMEQGLIACHGPTYRWLTTHGFDMANLAQPPLFIAATCPLDFLRVLVTEGADVNATNTDGDTLLIQLAGVGAPGTVETIAFLIGAGADRHARNNKGETALSRAEASWVAAREMQDAESTAESMRILTLLRK